MRRCGCAGSGCSCLVIGGDGIEVIGVGSPEDPYRVSSTAATISQSLRVQSTPSQSRGRHRGGPPLGPLKQRGVASPALADLADVFDTAPVAGDVPVWVESVDGDHWEFMPPPAADPGAVTTGAGLIGDGSGGAPLRANTSGVFGAGTLANLGVADTAGGVVYTDSTGKLRVAPTGLATRSATTPTNIGGLFWYKTDSAEMFWGNGSTWTSVGAGGSPVTDQDIADAVEAYFVSHPATLNDANVASLFEDTTTATYNAVNDMIVALIPAGGGGSFDPAAAQTITGLWNFSTAPTVPNNAFTTAKISGFTAAVTTIADASAALVVGGAPTALNTLGKVSTALGGDPAFATTVNASIATKANDSAVVHLTGVETVGGTKTFTNAPLVPDGAFTFAKVANLQTTINLLAPKANPAFTGTASLVNLAVTGTVTLPAATITDANLASGTSFLAAERTKLAGITAGATANSPDASLRDRTTHTGFLPVSAVAGTPGAGKYWDGGTGQWTTLPAGSGGSTTTDASLLTSGILPPARIGDASIADGKLVGGTAFAPSERLKLAGITPLATANSPDANLRDRSTHTGTQLAATISDLPGLLATKADLVSGALPVAQIAKTLNLTTEDLDSFTYNMTGHQASGAGATLALHYPVAGLPGFVRTDASATGATTAQRFTSPSSGRSFTRGLATGVWGPWTEAATTAAPTFTGTTTVAALTATGAVSVPDGSFAIAKTTGLQTALNTKITWRNSWAPSTAYAVNDMFEAPNGAIFIVLSAHTSGASAPTTDFSVLSVPAGRIIGWRTAPTPTYVTAMPDQTFTIIKTGANWPGGTATTWPRGATYTDPAARTSRADLHFTLLDTGTTPPTGFLAGADFYERV